MFRKWKPSKAKAAEFKKNMDNLEDFLLTHADISSSMSRDSFYFTHAGTKYRISNHSIESSNSKAYNYLGEQVREKYHADHRNTDTRYIHASKTRLIEIYNAIVSGMNVDGRGNIIY